jgi:hypothetical protein
MASVLVCTGFDGFGDHEATTATTAETPLAPVRARDVSLHSDRVPYYPPRYIGSRALERSLMAASAAPAATLPVAVQVRENVATLADSPPLDELPDEPSPEGGTVALKLVVSAHGANGSDHCLSCRLSCRQKERPPSPHLAADQRQRAREFTAHRGVRDKRAAPNAVSRSPRSPARCVSTSTIYCEYTRARETGYPRLTITVGSEAPKPNQAPE